MATSNKYVAEIQGLYGPFTMAERVVQKIWLQRDFSLAGASLIDGRALEVRSPGRWNLLGGPDFRSARLVMGGALVTGDVEVHFHSADWRAHGHAADTAYDNVALHVVLFPLREGERAAVRREGQPIPTLVLLPLLHRDLEEYAGDDALETITARDQWRHFAELAGRSLDELQLLMQTKARDAWRQKIHFAKLRIEKLGWSAALHHAALEVLGYRQNRAAMLAVAGKYPLETWSRSIEPEKIFEEHGSHWRLQGVRPANHPRTRLQQYHRWALANPNWPNGVLSQFAEISGKLPESTPTRTARRLLNLTDRRKIVVRDLVGENLGGTRLDNLVCDGLLPLLAAATGKDYFELWFHWYLGDVPDQVRRTLPKLGLADGQLQPFCHGYARGLLSWFLECEARASG